MKYSININITILLIKEIIRPLDSIKPLDLSLVEMYPINHCL